MCKIMIACDESRASTEETFCTVGCNKLSHFGSSEYISWDLSTPMSLS